MIVNEMLGRQFREAREKKKWSQGDVAKLLNCTQTTISNLERGQRDPHLSLVIRYAWLLGYRVKLERHECEAGSSSAAS